MRQLALDYAPPQPEPRPVVVRAARPPHNPLIGIRLQDAAEKILALLRDRQAHARTELEAIAGNRYAARLGEVRDAVWPEEVVLGPRPQPSRGVREIEPMVDGVEFYKVRRKR